jgi:hypothetical protein
MTGINVDGRSPFNFILRDITESGAYYSSFWNLRLNGEFKLTEDGWDGSWLSWLIWLGSSLSIIPLFSGGVIGGDGSGIGGVSISDRLHPVVKSSTWDGSLIVSLDEGRGVCGDQGNVIELIIWGNEGSSWLWGGMNSGIEFEEEIIGSITNESSSGGSKSGVFHEVEFPVIGNSIRGGINGNNWGSALGHNNE